MLDNLIFLAPPMTVCIILAGILSYFGNHILSRGIIFIDIAVAQIAALGTMIGILLGYAEESAQVQYISYGVTIAVLAVFALSKGRKQLLPQEVVIGILYCISLGLALLLADKIPGGSNYITKTITGNVLWVTWQSILHCSIIVAVIAVIHVFIGPGLQKLSTGIDKSEHETRNDRILNLLFYITFGILIVRAVPVMGIFLVFILLIAPAAIVRLYTDNWRKKVLWSWAVGAAGSVIGMYSSFQLNISNGPAIVCILGVAALVLTFLKLFVKQKAASAVMINNKKMDRT
jgi:zinc/manganese transport system permease protein